MRLMRPALQVAAAVVKADLPNVAALNAAVSFPIVLHETKTSLLSYLRDAGLPVSLQQLHEMIASPDVKELVGLR
jgi:mandelamide amidase